MSFLNRVLLFFVVLGVINIIMLVIAKKKSKSAKVEGKRKRKKGDIRVLNYNDENLICMVENNLEQKYGYECDELKIFENMKLSHRNIYTLLWFDTEMHNGGLGEYLFSTSNITTPYLQKAFEDVKALELLQSYKIFIEQNNIENTINNMNERSVEEYFQFINKFDFSNFNDLYEKTDLRLLVADYIRNNIIDFCDLDESELKVSRQIEKEQEQQKN